MWSGGQLYPLWWPPPVLIGPSLLGFRTSGDYGRIRITNTLTARRRTKGRKGRKGGEKRLRSHLSQGLGLPYHHPYPIPPPLPRSSHHNGRLFWICWICVALGRGNIMYDCDKSEAYHETSNGELNQREKIEGKR